MGGSNTVCPGPVALGRQGSQFPRGVATGTVQSDGPASDRTGTQGQGIAHRRECANLGRLAKVSPDRLLDVAWGLHRGRCYRAEIMVDADDRRGLPRDVSDAVTGEHIDILAVNTLSDRSTETARMTFVVEIEREKSGSCAGLPEGGLRDKAANPPDFCGNAVKPITSAAP